MATRFHLERLQPSVRLVADTSFQLLRRNKVWRPHLDGGVACTPPANRIVLQATWKCFSRKFHHLPDFFTKCQGNQLRWLEDCRNVLHRNIFWTRVSCERKSCRADWFVELGYCRRPALIGGGRILLLTGASTSPINPPPPSPSILLPLSSFIIQFHRQSNKIHSKAPHKFFASFSST